MCTYMFAFSPTCIVACACACAHIGRVGGTPFSLAVWSWAWSLLRSLTCNESGDTALKRESVLYNHACKKAEDIHGQA